MSNDEKRWIILLIAVIAIAIVLIVALSNKKEPTKQGNIVEEETNQKTYAVKLEDGTKINVSEEMKQTKRYNELEISNIQFTEKNGMSVLLAEVKNIGNTTHARERVKITIIGEDNEEITTINPIIGEVKAGETIELNASVTADVVNAKDIKIEARK